MVRWLLGERQSLHDCNMGSIPILTSVKLIYMYNKKNIVKREIIKKDKTTKYYFILLVLKAKFIENKTKGKEIDFMFNNCDVESLLFNGKIYQLI